MNLLTLLISLNLFTLVILSLDINPFLSKIFSLISSFALLFVGCLIWLFFDPKNTYLQYEVLLILFNSLGLNYHIGVDGLNLFFILLSLLLLPIVILCSWTTINYKVRYYQFLLHLITFLLIHVFCVQDLLLFYIFFESILIPMFVIIGIWGSRNRKIHAAYQFFLYTLTGSVAMLIAILYLLVSYGSVDIYLLETINYSIEEGRLLWLALFLSFAVKVPMVPVHIWLPEAHVEAPTGGSVILAGILLKMGTYGMLKFLLPVFTEASLFYQPLVYILSIIGILYASCTTIRQIDLKKIIAYSSVGHMNFVTLGIFGGTIYGLEGSIFLMISHGFVSSALFLCVGWLYERYGTRIIFYYGGLVFGMPIFSVFFLVLTLANISLPGTSSFVGEFLILLNCFYTNRVICFLASLGVLLGAIYAMWLYNRMIFGLVKIPLIKTYSDLNRREFFLLSILILLIIVTGLYPKIILEYLHPFVQLILNK